MGLPVLLGAITEERALALVERSTHEEPAPVAVPDSLDQLAGSGAFEVSRTVGHGDDDFAAAAESILGLRLQRAVAGVFPADATAAEGATILVALRFGPVTVTAVNRIVRVVQEPGRVGFLYATLPCHPERGEEAFLVERRSDGSVVGTIRGRGDLAVPLGRLGRPVLRPLQHRFAHRYLDAVEADVGTARSRPT